MGRKATERSGRAPGRLSVRHVHQADTLVVPTARQRLPVLAERQRAQGQCEAGGQAEQLARRVRQQSHGTVFTPCGHFAVAAARHTVHARLVVSHAALTASRSQRLHVAQVHQAIHSARQEVLTITVGAVHQAALAAHVGKLPSGLGHRERHSQGTGEGRSSEQRWCVVVVVHSSFVVRRGACSGR